MDRQAICPIRSPSMMPHDLCMDFSLVALATFETAEKLLSTQVRGRMDSCQATSRRTTRQQSTQRKFTLISSNPICTHLGDGWRWSIVESAAGDLVWNEHGEPASSNKFYTNQPSKSFWHEFNWIWFQFVCDTNRIFV